MQWSEKCVGCCFKDEPSMTWMWCDHCKRNPMSPQNSDDKFTALVKKWDYFDPR